MQFNDLRLVQSSKIELLTSVMAQLQNIAILAIAIYLAWNRFQLKRISEDKLLPKYDYIVVGGGSAGSVVAARLSEDVDVTVAVLEAGQEETQHPGTRVPLNLFLSQNTEIDWAYRTVPQKKACNGLKDNRSAWPRGKLLGGSGQINGMWYVRGNRHDYDRWAEEYGANGWTYAEVLPYFMKSESHQKSEFVKSGYHGNSGPMTITVSDRTPEITHLYLNASKEIGHKVLDEINGKEQEGYSPMSAYIKRGVRVDSASAFLRPAMSRENLHVLTEAHVTRVLFEGKRAVGVEYVKNGRLETISANREVILSAGSIGSPHILMLSGIGHRHHLEKFNIDVLADLPVGDNLQDHIMVYPFDYQIDQPFSITLPKAESLSEVSKYMLFGEGILGTSSYEGLGFYRSKHQPKNDPRPYMQSGVCSSLVGNSHMQAMLTKRGFNLKDEVSENWLGKHLNKYGFSQLVGLQRPTSRGSIRLQSGNPFHDPLIDPKYLDTQEDMKNMIYGIRNEQRYIKTKTFKDSGVKLLERIHPLCSHLKPDSDEYWECYIRADTLTIYHPTSTCKMGRVEDNTTVVDSQLRVHGIKGLRIVDASIMPEITTGNTYAPVIMIAEKAADMIKGKTLPPVKHL